jgi:hypothetical protein
LTRVGLVTTLAAVSVPLTESRAIAPRIALIALALALAPSAGCAGPPVPAPIKGEPVCPDYEIGATKTKMQGSLRYPVMLTILDGSTVMNTTMILGRRTEKDPPVRTLLSDSDEEYTVQWAQCENERAPRPVAGGADTKEALRYECGKAEVYATVKLQTRKGDLSTHELAFAPPPKTECWMSDVPAPAAADAGAPDADTLATDAGTEPDAAPSDAGAEIADAAASDAAAPSDAGAEPKDAGSDAGAKKKKKPATPPAAPPATP